MEGAVEALRKAAALPAPQTLRIVNGQIALRLPPHSLFLLEIR